MNHLYYACDLTIDFNRIDLDFIFDYLSQKNFELRVLRHNDNIDRNDFIPIALKIHNENDMQNFIRDIGQFIFADEWYNIPKNRFENGKLIDISQENRQNFHLIYNSLRRAIEDSNKFFRYIYYPSKPISIYRVGWTLHEIGLKSSFIENMFKIESKNQNIRVVDSGLETNLLIYFFVAMPKDEDFNEILSEFPDEAKNLKWEQINQQQVPKFLYGNPLNMDGNIYPVWRESLWNALQRDKK